MFVHFEWGSVHLSDMVYSRNRLCLRNDTVEELSACKHNFYMQSDKFFQHHCNDTVEVMILYMGNCHNTLSLWISHTDLHRLWRATEWLRNLDRNEHQLLLSQRTLGAKSKKLLSATLLSSVPSFSHYKFLSPKNMSIYNGVHVHIKIEKTCFSCFSSLIFKYFLTLQVNLVIFCAISNVF